MFLFLTAGVVMACTPPSFPGTFSEIEEKEDQQLLDDFTRDYERHIELYNKAYPCPMYGDISPPSAKELEALQAEMTALEQKWTDKTPPESEAREIPEIKEEDGYYEIDLEEGKSYNFE